MKVWQETEIQEIQLNQHFFQFTLSIVYIAIYANIETGLR